MVYKHIRLAVEEIFILHFIQFTLNLTILLQKRLEVLPPTALSLGTTLHQRITF